MVKFRQKRFSCHEALELPPPPPKNKKVVYVAAAALVDADGRVLLAQRPEGKTMAGLWEFPGGKIHEKETPEYALMRELEEELGVITRPCCFSPVTFASHSYDTFHLFMPLYICRVWKGPVKSREKQEFAWVRPENLYDYAMPEADIPLIGPLREAI